MTNNNSEESVATPLEGKLKCTHCGQTFIVHEGQHVKIDHFKDCPGTN